MYPGYLISKPRVEKISLSMKFPLLLILASTVLSSGLDASESAVSIAEIIQDLNQLNLSELVNKDDAGKLNVWLLEKKMEIESVVDAGSMKASGSSDDMTTNSSNSIKSASPDMSEISTSSCSASPKESSESEPIISERDIQNAFCLAVHKKRYNEAVQHLKLIPDWKMTIEGANSSVLSLLRKEAKSKFIGRLSHPLIAEIFAPLLQGKNSEFCSGYLAALSLFRPDIQLQVMERLISNAPHLSGFLLQTSIYYSLNESVIKMLLNSGVSITFANNMHFNPLHGIQNVRKLDKSQQLQLSQYFFMNFSDRSSGFAELFRRTSRDVEVNFLMGMVDDSIPHDVGVLRVAFEEYKPEIVMALIDLCPFPQMANYHLAHLLAKKGPTPDVHEYPSIASLVDSRIVLDSLTTGSADLVALSFLPNLSPSDQNAKIDEFIVKTNIFSTHSLHYPRTIQFSTSKVVKEATGLSDLPSSPAVVFLLTACKWNIDDEAFEKIYRACKKIANSRFYIAKREATEWATKNGLTKKLEIMV